MDETRSRLGVDLLRPQHLQSDDPAECLDHRRGVRPPCRRGRFLLRSDIDPLCNRRANDIRFSEGPRFEGKLSLADCSSVRPGRGRGLRPARWEARARAAPSGAARDYRRADQVRSGIVKHPATWASTAAGSGEEPVTNCSRVSEEGQFICSYLRRGSLPPARALPVPGASTLSTWRRKRLRETH